MVPGNPTRHRYSENCPDQLLPDDDLFPQAARETDLQKGIDGADVVMALRIQRERIADLDGIPDVENYYTNFGVTHARLKKAAKDAIVMHPGPMNRDVEIASGVADGPQSVIEEQVTSGLAVRMAVLAAVVRNSEKS